MGKGFKGNEAPLKITVVGNSNVGKTSLLLTYKNNKYEDSEENFEPVCEDYEKIITLEGINIPVILCDSATQKEYAPLRRLAYRSTDCFIICYGVNQPSSFADVERTWMPELQKYCKKVPYILIGTKSDMKIKSVQNSLMNNADGENLKNSIKASAFFECSAKEMIGLETVITTAARLALNYRYGNKRGSCIVF